MYECVEVPMWTCVSKVLCGRTWQRSCADVRVMKFCLDECDKGHSWTNIENVWKQDKIRYMDESICFASNFV